MDAPRMSNSVSLTRSAMGRVRRSRGALSGMPRAVPAITRIGQAIRWSSGRITLLVAGSEIVTQPDQLGPPDEAGVSSHQPLSELSRALGELQVARIEERRHAEGRQSALPRPQQVPSPTQLQ